MDNVKIARDLSDLLRSIRKKESDLRDVTGLHLSEFISELDDLDDLVVRLLNVPPWECDEAVVHDYIDGQSSDSFNDVLRKVREARSTFVKEDYANFVSDYIDTYGNHPRLDERYE